MAAQGSLGHKRKMLLTSTFLGEVAEKNYCSKFKFNTVEL